MRLQKLKIRGLAPLPQTEWLRLGSAITLLQVPGKKAGWNLLQAIETLNPRYECREAQPFRHLSREVVTAGGHRRMVRPEKRTIAFGIFDSPPALVRDLAAITTYLYEADQIEIGRRLDYSRWINFVEIPSSSRWSELSADIEKLSESLPGDSAPPPDVQRLLQELKPTDRIKGTTGDQLAEWLGTLKKNGPDEVHLETIMKKVLRWKRFNEARHTLGLVFPLFIPVGLAFDGLHQKLQELAEISAEAMFPPIILLDCLEVSLPRKTDENIASFLRDLSARFQCLWFTSEPPPDWIARLLPAHAESIVIGNAPGH